MAEDNYKRNHYIQYTHQSAGGGFGLHCTIYHTANAGIYFNVGGIGGFIDALPHHTVNGFDALTDQQARLLFDIVSLRPPDFLLATHNHPDHYSYSLMQQAHAYFPHMKLILPWSEMHNTVSYENWSVEWFPLPHAHVDTAKYVDNYGVMIHCGKYRLFTPGDADPRFPEVYDRVAGLNPDIAFLNFPWITLPSASRCLNALNPRYSVISHLPTIDCGPINFHDAVQRALQSSHYNAVVLDTFLQKAEFDL